ncbi:hypothetical protein V8G54_023289, partial [Vigna mungo]
EKCTRKARSLVKGSVYSGSGREGRDCDVGKYASSDFSMVVVQVNQVLEDQRQIESSPLGTFVDKYDGHSSAHHILFLSFFSLFFITSSFHLSLLHSPFSLSPFKNPNTSPP